jgi:hypothetical protein
MLLKRHGGCARVAPASRDARTTMTRLPHATHALHWLNSNDPDAVSCLVSFYTAHVQSVALCLTTYAFERLERGDSSHGIRSRLNFAEFLLQEVCHLSFVSCAINYPRKCSVHYYN